MAASISPPGRLRVAVAQLAYHPAILVDRRSPLEDPLFDPASPDSLSPERGELPLQLKGKLDALRGRVRVTYNAQLFGRVRAVLARCNAWGARVVVFPEHSIPWELLPLIAAEAGDLVVCAGTHMVEQAARRSGLYETLGSPFRPAVGQSVCPVLYGGRLLALVPKVHAAGAERSSMKPGEAWAPVEMPDGIPGPLGVLTALDFLSRDSDRYGALIADKLSQCPFLAVMGQTPGSTPPEFAGTTPDAARRYGRPVLYSGAAEGGGTSIYAASAGPDDLRRFPDRAGYLEPDDEGVIIADVLLNHEGSPAGPPVTPFAAASLVYRGHPVGEEYARWLEEVEALLASDDDDALDAAALRINEASDLLLNAGALSGGEARGRRLRRLLAELDKVTRVEEIRQFTREIGLPKEIVPLADLRTAMAGAAADVMFGWLASQEARAAGIAEVEVRLREAADEHISAGTWTSEGLIALAAVARAVHGAPDTTAAEVSAVGKVSVVAPAVVAPSGLGKREQEGVVLLFRERPSEVRTLESDLRNQEDLPALPNLEMERAEPLYWLAVAEGAGASEGGDPVCAVGVFPKRAPDAATVLVLSKRGDVWEVWTARSEAWPEETWALVRGALRECGLGEVTVLSLDPEGADFDARVRALLPRFERANGLVRAFRDQRLRDMDGAFLEADARVNGGERMPVFSALKEWLAGSQQTALVLGDYGSGKSVALAEWSGRRWDRGEHPLPIFVSLAAARSSRDAEALLLDAAGLEDRPAHRASLRLLLKGPRPFLIPVFDGFDEMATRLTDKELAGSLSALIQAARGGGRVVISARASFFSSESHLGAATVSALEQALRLSSGLSRIELELFTADQIRAMIGRFRAKEGDAAEVFERIRKIDDLSDIIRRPLLLGMVLAALNNLATGGRITRSDLYEAYLRRWLDQTRSGDPDCFTDEQKRELAESLADELWRSGRPASSWQEIKSSVRARLAHHLPEQMPRGAAFVEIQLGGLLMREGEDRFRFAHKTLLEYFLAKSLITVLPRRAFAALRTAPFTQEIAGFLGEIADVNGEARESAPIVALQQFLQDGRKPHTRPHGASAREPDTAESAAAAAANALRLLLGLKRWARDKAAWIPEGADLRRVHLAGEDLSDASLAFADLERADLTGADLSRADLTGAYLEDASLMRARLNRTTLARAKVRRVDFTQAEASEAILDGADLTDAILRQSLWLRCSLQGVTLEGADLTGAAMPGCEPKSLAREAVKVTPPLTLATIPEIPAGRIHAAAFSQDGRYLALGDAGNTISLLSYPSGAPLARIDAGAPVLTVTISPDGSRIAGGGLDGTARVFEAATGAALVGLKAHSGRIKEVAYSPDGKRIATLSDTDPAVRIFDADDFREILRLDGDRGMDQLAWSPDGRQIATAGPGDLVRLWDARAGALLASQKALHGPLAALAWSPDGNLLAVVGSRRIHLLDGRTAAEITFLRHAHGVPYGIAWSADSTRIASAGIFGALHLWDAEKRTELRRLPDEGFAGLLVALHWGPDDDLVTRVSSDGEILRTDITSPSMSMKLASNSAIEIGRRRKVERSPGGYCALPDGGRSDCVLALRRPEPGSRSEIYIPLGGLYSIVHRPEIVAAAREGDRSDDDLGAELARLGLDNGSAWDGRPKRVARARPGAELAGSHAAHTTPDIVITAERDSSSIELAQIQPNPFRPGSALTQGSTLPGRAPVLAELLALIESRSPAILIGPRRSGKTSILHHIAARLTVSRTAARVRHVTLEAKRVHSSDDLARVLDPTLHADPSPAETLRRRLEEQSSTVLLLDEVANLCGADTSVFAWLRALGQEGTSVVFAGSPWDWVRTALHAASAPGSSFGNDVTPVVLGPIPERDAVLFLTETSPPDVPIKEDRTARWIVEQCGPWPFYLQVMGYAVVQEVRAGRRKALVERSALLDLYDQRLLLERDAAFFHARWAELPERAKQILRRIRGTSGGDLPAYRDLPPEDRKILRDTGLCDFGKWLQDKPFYDWIRRGGGDIEDEAGTKS